MKKYSMGMKVIGIGLFLSLLVLLSTTAYLLQLTDRSFKEQLLFEFSEINAILAKLREGVVEAEQGVASGLGKFASSGVFAPSPAPTEEEETHGGCQKVGPKVAKFLDR